MFSPTQYSVDIIYLLTLGYVLRVLIVLYNGSLFF